LIQHQEQKNKTYYSIYITTIAFGCLIHLLFSFGQNKEKIKTSYDTEVRIAKNFDELANDVYQTMAFVEMQDLSYSYNKETLLDNLDTIYSRTRNISKENSTIAMGPDYIPNLKR
jgi:hypothetical protein